MFLRKDWLEKLDLPAFFFFFFHKDNNVIMLYLKHITLSFIIHMNISRIGMVITHHHVIIRMKCGHFGGMSGNSRWHAHR